MDPVAELFLPWFVVGTIIQFVAGALFYGFIGVFAFLAARKLIKDKRDKAGWRFALFAAMPLALVGLVRSGQELVQLLRVAHVRSLPEKGIMGEPPRTLVIVDSRAFPPAPIAYYLAETGLFDVYAVNGRSRLPRRTEAETVAKLAVVESDDCRLRRRDLRDLVVQMNYRRCARAVPHAEPAEGLFLYLDEDSAPNALKWGPAQTSRGTRWAIELTLKRAGKSSVIAYDEAVAYAKTILTIHGPKLRSRDLDPTDRRRPDPIQFLFAATGIDRRVVAPADQRAASPKDDTFALRCPAKPNRDDATSAQRSNNQAATRSRSATVPPEFWLSGTHGRATADFDPPVLIAALSDRSITQSQRFFDILKDPRITDEIIVGTLRPRFFGCEADLGFGRLSQVLRERPSMFPQLQPDIVAAIDQAHVMDQSQVTSLREILIMHPGPARLVPNLLYGLIPEGEVGGIGSATVAMLAKERPDWICSRLDDVADQVRMSNHSHWLIGPISAACGDAVESLLVAAFERGNALHSSTLRIIASLPAERRVRFHPMILENFAKPIDSWALSGNELSDRLTAALDAGLSCEAIEQGLVPASEPRTRLAWPLPARLAALQPCAGRVTAKPSFSPTRP